MEEEWVWWDIELKLQDKNFKNYSIRERDYEEPLLKLRLRCKDDIKIKLKNKLWSVHWIYLAQNIVAWWPHIIINVNSVVPQ
jgi:hypothetical protein